MTDPRFDTARWRTLLFVPGSRPDRFEKADKAGADIVCIDLEDAVAPAGKEDARRATLTFLKDYQSRNGLVGLRVNAVDTPEGQQDLEAIQNQSGIDFIMVPKVGGPGNITTVQKTYAKPMIIPVLESARAIQQVDAIADHPGVTAAIYGAIDLAADIGCDLSWDAHLYGRSRCAIAFGAAQKVLFDVPYLDVKDDEGLIRETKRSQALGIHARAAIHPKQIAGINKALAPSESAIKHAEKVIAAFEASTTGLALLDGKLIELPVIKSAQRILAASNR